MGGGRAAAQSISKDQIHSVRYTPSSSQIPSLRGAGLDVCTGVRSRRKVSPRLGRKHNFARSIVSNTLPKAFERTRSFGFDSAVARVPLSTVKYSPSNTLHQIHS